MSAKNAVGNSSSLVFSSCNPTTSGLRASSQRRMKSSRARSPLMFHVAMRMAAAYGHCPVEAMPHFCAIQQAYEGATDNPVIVRVTSRRSGADTAHPRAPPRPREGEPMQQQNPVPNDDPLSLVGLIV